MEKLLAKNVAKKHIDKVMWSADMIHQLIEYYEQHSFLWKRTDANYKNAQKRKQADLEISKLLNISANEGKRKWRHLRQTFFQYQKKPRKVTWQFYTRLSFLNAQSAAVKPDTPKKAAQKSAIVLDDSVSTPPATPAAVLEPSQQAVPKAQEPLAPVYNIKTEFGAGKDQFDEFAFGVASDLRMVSAYYPAELKNLLFDIKLFINLKIQEIRKREHEFQFDCDKFEPDDHD